MSTPIKAGQRLASVVCATEVMVVRAPDDPVDLRCGGRPMVPAGTQGERLEPTAGTSNGSQLGKRYVDEDDRLEVLCIKPGDGSLSLGAEVLTMRTTKALPSSD
jgi:hypothetical protein